MNTMLKPRMKPMEFSITLRNNWDSCDFSSSTPTPEISDTYPGTSGNTQGDRNETRPARKAAIGSGRFAIQDYCTFCRCTGAECRGIDNFITCALLPRFRPHFAGRLR